jgi:hypothetical protein
MRSPSQVNRKFWIRCSCVCVCSCACVCVCVCACKSPKLSLYFRFPTAIFLNYSLVFHRFFYISHILPTLIRTLKNIGWKIQIISMCVCTYVCMYVCIYVCVYVCMYVCTYVCMYVRMYVCTYVCMYVCQHIAPLMLFTNNDVFIKE